MKRIDNIITLIMLLSLWQITCLSQEQNLMGEIKTGIIKEKISLSTDRSLYCVGEKILFVANYTTNRDYINKTWSSVIYVEIITQEGTSMVQAKFPIERNSCSGELFLPHDALTGMYYIKAYTKWMRNFETNTYAYSQIKIINPNNSALENNNIDSNRNTDLRIKALNNIEAINILTKKQVFTKREKVEVSLSQQSERLNYNNYSISVVKSGSVVANTVQLKEPEFITPENTLAEFLPEIKGLSISGQVLNSSTMEPVEGVKVDLALLNNLSYLSGFTTNSKGEFFFTFPYSERSHDFYLHAKKDETLLNVQINDDFCTKPIQLPYKDFVLTDLEKQLAKEICINALIEKAYSKAIASERKTSKKDEKSFYGTPDRKVYTNNFVELPYLEEFIFELAQEISVYRKKEVLHIRTNKRISTDNIPYLVLVDNIPIEDLEAVLKIKTNKIERLEIINSSYIIGNNIYGGVLNVITKNRDMAGLELPQNSMFFSYDLLSDPYLPNNVINNNSRIPDRRNTLFWNPEYFLKEEAENKFSFYTSDVPGKYSIVIQGTTTSNDKVLIAQEEIIVE